MEISSRTITWFDVPSPYHFNTNVFKARLLAFSPGPVGDHIKRITMMAWIWMERIHAIQRDSVPNIRNKIISTESVLHHICWWWMTNDMIHTTHLHIQRWLCPPGTAAPHTNYFQTICSTLMDTRTTTFKPTRNHFRLQSTYGRKVTLYKISKVELSTKELQTPYFSRPELRSPYFSTPELRIPYFSTPNLRHRLII